MCVNAVVGQCFMPRYSPANNLVHLNSVLVFFKIFIKRLFPTEFQQISGRMISFDHLFLRCLINSYAHVFDAINLNMYLDFKNTLKLIFLSQEQGVGLFAHLNELGISFPAFIDALYFADALVSNSKYLADVEPQFFLANVEKALQLNFRDFPSVICRLLKSIDFLFGCEFMKEELGQL